MAEEVPKDREKAKEQLYEAEMKKRFKEIVRQTFMDQTDMCVYEEPWPFKMQKNAPNKMATKLWSELKKKGFIKI